MRYPSTIAGCCRELLDSSLDDAGRPVPRTLQDLTAHAVAEGRTTARYPEMSVQTVLRDEPAVLVLEGQRFLSVARLLEGRVFTTRTGPGCHLEGQRGAFGGHVPFESADRGVDLGPLRLVTSVSIIESPLDEDCVLAYRYLDGELTREVVARSNLSDGGELVTAVRALREERSRWARDASPEIVLACASDDRLLREPVAPLSELMPELLPDPPRPPRPPYPRQRACRTCDGMGVEQDWGSGFPSDGFDESESPSDRAEGLPGGWRTRIERLEHEAFGTEPFVGSAAVVPSRPWSLW